MLKGKLKYMVLAIGVFVISLGIMRYTPLAYASNGNPVNFSGPRGQHRMMWDYEGEEDWEDFRGPRGHHGMMWGSGKEYDGQEDWREFRGHRGCMRYYDDYEVEEESNK